MPRRAPAIVATLGITAAGLAVTGCGDADNAAGPSPARPTRAVIAAHRPLLVAPPRAAAPVRPAAAAPACRATVATTLARIARRVYAEEAGGANVVSATRRLARSRALAAAVASGGRAATARALAPLLKHQIKRIEIRRGARVLVDDGTAPALAPTHGTIRAADGRVVGTYVLAVSNVRAITEITHTLTGAQVIVRGAGTAATTLAHPPARLPRRGTARLDGHRYDVASFAGRAYPSGALRVTLLRRHAAAPVCGATPAQTIAATVGAVARRLYDTEAKGPLVRRVLAHIATDAQLRRAVADHDPALLRVAVIRFFRTRSLHVVRVRATDATGRLVGDIGGRYALAPAARPVRTPTGKLLGHVTIAIQDDTGFIKLIRRFTGAEVRLGVRDGTVPGSSPVVGARRAADGSSFAAAGRRWTVGAFTVPGDFPRGPLAVTVATPTS